MRTDFVAIFAFFGFVRQIRRETQHLSNQKSLWRGMLGLRHHQSRNCCRSVGFCPCISVQQIDNHCDAVAGLFVDKTVYKTQTLNLHPHPCQKIEFWLRKSAIINILRVGQVFQIYINAVLGLLPEQAHIERGKGRVLLCGVVFGVSAGAVVKSGLPLRRN
jgi:hypothetical protein